MPFFHRFGKLTPIQIEFNTQDYCWKKCCLQPATASGKTEAIFAPIAELFVEKQWNNLAIVYIVPTRALANDAFARISGPFSELGVSTVVKHGDKPYFSQKKSPNCIITTPESQFAYS